MSHGVVTYISPVEAFETESRDQCNLGSGRAPGDNIYRSKTFLQNRKVFLAYIGTVETIKISSTTSKALDPDCKSVYRWYVGHYPSDCKSSVPPLGCNRYFMVLSATDQIFCGFITTDWSVAIALFIIQTFQAYQR